MTPSPTARLYQAAEQLASIVGPEFVQTDSGLTVTPANTQQVSAVLAYSTKNHLTISPKGGGTKQDWGQGDQPHIHLSLARLNRVLEHPWQDLTCTVQSGCTWSSLQDALARHGQFVALDPLFPSRASVGGILATNDSGALRQRYGSLRDLVIGMILVLADGTIARTGGKVVKNVAGYDLCKLLTGSLGTLAVITEANFRLHPLPQYPRSFTVTAPNSSRLAPLLAAIRGSYLLTQSLQVRRNAAEAHLDICLNAHPEAHQDKTLMLMVQQEGLSLTDASEDVWNSREGLFHNDVTILRASTLPTRVCAFADQLQKTQPGLSIFTVSQAIGLHSVALRGTPNEITDVINHLRANPEVNVTLLQPGQQARTASFQIPQPVLTLMGSIKRNFDPDGILNPGKFFAGE